MSARPLFAVHMEATTYEEVRCEACGVDWEAEDEAAREVVEDGFAAICTHVCILVCVDPGRVCAETDVPGEEVVHTDAAAPSVLTDLTSVGSTVAVDISAEDIELEFAIVEAGFRRRAAFVFLVVLRDHRLASKAAADRSETDKETKCQFFHYCSLVWFGLFAREGSRRGRVMEVEAGCKGIFSASK